MEPNNSNHKQQGQPSQDILDALGGSLPKLGPPPKKQLSVTLIAVVVTSLVVVFVIVLVVLLQSGDSTNKTDKSLVVGQRIKETSLVAAFPIINNFTNLVHQQDYETAQTYINSLSALGGQDLTKNLLEDFAGSGVQWDSCLIQQSSEYKAEKITDIDKIEYDVAYIPVVCKVEESGERILEFGIRRSSTTDWRIYDIVARNL